MAYSKRNGTVVPTYGSNKHVEALLEAGVVDAQALRRGDSARLASKLGLEEIQRASEEAGRIGEETGHVPELYGRPIADVVRVARAAQKQPENLELAQRVDDERALLYRKLAQTAAAKATHGQ